MSNPIALREDDLKLMLTANVHVGVENCDKNMEGYVWRRRQGGHYLINLGKTWEKLMLAARIIVTVENPEDVVAISARPFGQRAVFKFAQHTGCQYIGGRYTPGTFTNQKNRKFMEPRLLVVTDPLVDHQPIREASYVNIPVVAFCNTDSPLMHVDVAIPCNNKGRNSIALMYWLLAREILRMRAVISRNEPWGVVVDLFMYRDPKEVEEEDTVEIAPAPTAVEMAPVDIGGEDPFSKQDEGGVVEWGAETGSSTGFSNAPVTENWMPEGQSSTQDWTTQPVPQGWQESSYQ